MKTLFVFFIAVFAAQTGFSQLEKGDVLLGGSAALYMPVKSMYVKSSGLTLSPEYAVAKSTRRIVGVGASIGFANSRSKTGSDKETTLSLGASPFLQELVPINSNFYLTLTGQAGISFESGKKTTSNTVTSSGVGLSLNARPGVMYWSGKKWIVRLDIGNAHVLSGKIGSEQTGESTRKTRTTELDFRTVYRFTGTQIGLYYLLR